MKTQSVKIHRGTSSTWRVDCPTLLVDRNDQVIWTVEGEETAYFQFPPGLVQDKDGNEVEYASIGSGVELTLYIVEDARQTIMRGERVGPPHYYAVWMGDGFVRGSNPPPKVDIGG